MSDDNWDVWNDEDYARRGVAARRKKRSDDDGYDIADVVVIKETGAAILVRGKGLSADPFGLADPNEEGWIPLSQLHDRSEVRHEGDRGLLVISQWLASKRGLV